MIVAEAHQESRSITRAAQSERERLFAESRRVETLLRAALGIVEETQHDAAPRDEGAARRAAELAEPRAHAEFEAISMEDVAAETSPSRSRSRRGAARRRGGARRRRHPAVRPGLRLGVRRQPRMPSTLACMTDIDTSQYRARLLEEQRAAR